MPWFADYQFDMRSRRLFRRGREVSLSPKAWDVLYYLVERPGQLVSREELFEALWPGVFVDDHALFRAGVAGILAREPDLEGVGEADDSRSAVDRALGF